MDNSPLTDCRHEAADILVLPAIRADRKGSSAAVST